MISNFVLGFIEQHDAFVTPNANVNCVNRKTAKLHATLNIPLKTWDCDLILAFCEKLFGSHGNLTSKHTSQYVVVRVVPK